MYLDPLPDPHHHHHRNTKDCQFALLHRVNAFVTACNSLSLSSKIGRGRCICLGFFLIIRMSRSTDNHRVKIAKKNEVTMNLFSEIIALENQLLTNKVIQPLSLQLT